jgi:hypothetical protein
LEEKMLALVFGVLTPEEERRAFKTRVFQAEALLSSTTKQE